MRKQLRKRTRTPGQRDQAKRPVWKNTLADVEWRHWDRARADMDAHKQPMEAR